ncbi:PaaX family transcriptional regulator [Oerskovia jenensis]|uniref:Phenylacetic acid degradation operon negative regulatory protein n=1 Tax=Oerskovia jenensis TaxID=162169 RepID=A0ABS2LAM5_9CELL|nr:PaaX family transcriptional regulator [Oerskovia jenensis]MBM7477471.1 phenylacetic acid degradation operon negative regulatory protein [Oerskovia jenensis]
MTHQIAPRTVVEAFLPASGEVLLADIYDTANLAGLPDQPVRLAIRRLIAGGDVTQHGRGRAGTLSLTSAGHLRMQRDRQSLALAFAQDAGDAPWDGRWRIIAVSVPERERTVRDTLRRELRDLGAVAISTGLYVSPHHLVDVLHMDASPYLSTATTDDLDVRGITDPLAIAELLWPHRPTVSAYAAVDAALQQDGEDPTTTAVVRKLQLADALERAIRDDPLLPPELRGRAWVPTQIRAAWARRWDTLHADTRNAIYEGWWPPATTAYR